MKLQLLIVSLCFVVRGTYETPVGDTIIILNEPATTSPVRTAPSTSVPTVNRRKVSSIQQYHSSSTANYRYEDCNIVTLANGQTVCDPKNYKVTTVVTARGTDSTYTSLSYAEARNLVDKTIHMIQEPNTGLYVAYHYVLTNPNYEKYQYTLAPISSHSEFPPTTKYIYTGALSDTVYIEKGTNSHRF